MKKRAPSGWQLGMQRGAHQPPHEPSKFDLLLAELKITEKDAARHAAVQMWVWENYQRYFVPEKILSAVGVDRHFL